MKKVAFLVLAVVIGYLVLQKSSEKKREMLVGTWKMERQISGGASRMHINLKPEGDFTSWSMLRAEGKQRLESPPANGRCFPGR